MPIRGLLYLALAAFGLVLSGIWGRQMMRARHQVPEDPAQQVGPPTPAHLLVGFVTNFFDTLGIGSFAPTTAIFKLLRIVPDRLIPGTLLVGHAAPILTQAFIYITIIEVEMTTLVLLIAAAVVGSALGANVVSRWPKRRVQLGMGVALLVAASIMFCQAVKVLPQGGNSVGLSGVALAIGLVGNFVLGALMTIGIGAYAPSLVLFGLLGMNLKSVFPVMMGSCAFLMPVSSVQFLRRGSYSPRAALGLTVAGVPAVLIAAYAVGELSVSSVRWLVVAVVVYTAAAMLRSAAREKA